ncbi:epimerase, partial [Micromonospora azadirachtae]
VLTPELVARHFHGWTVPIAAPVLLAAAKLTWYARLQPIDAGWVQLALSSPLMSSERAESELGWQPRVDAVAALKELFTGMAERAHTASPPMSGTPDLPGRPSALLKGNPTAQQNPY